MDLKVRQDLHATLEKLTHSGAPSLNQELMKKIKNICRQSDVYVQAAYEIVMNDLRENHAEVRLSAFQVANELFIRSHLFRELVISNFKRFASLITGTDPASHLPLPKDSAAQLKKSSLLAIKQWNQKYGDAYPKLKLGFNYLKFNRKVDFEELVAQNEAERRRREEGEVRHRTILKQRMQEVKQEMVGLKQEINSCLTEVNSCFNLILPRFDGPDIYTCTDTPHQDTNCSLKTTDNLATSSSCSHPNAKIEVHQSKSPQCDHPLPESKDMTRRRTVSSDSFVSISEGSGTDSDEEVEGGYPEDSNTSAVNLDFADPVYSSDSEVEWEDVEPVYTAQVGVDLQEHGLIAHSFSIPIQLNPRVEVKETEDNSSILATLRERKKMLVSHHLPAINRCLEWMVKGGEERCVREAIDLKGKINTILSKYQKLHIMYKNPSPDRKQLGSDSEEMQDTVTSSQPTSTEWEFGSEIPESVTGVDVELDPTTPHAQIAHLKKKLAAKAPLPSDLAHSSSSDYLKTKDSDLLARAPVVPYGMDLYHWDNPSSSALEPRTLVQVGSLHRFWAEEKEVSISKDERDRLRCRTISFPGQFQPVMKSCRAVLPSGKLCPRKDRYKCPFHGTIIPRDEHGTPVSTDQECSSHHVVGETLSLVTDRPLWEDEQLQEEIMVATGVELSKEKKEKKGKGKKKLSTKFPGLTDLTRHVDTPRKRLERKVLSKHSLRRVADDVDRLDTKKFTDKFGNNFNYALKN